MAASGSHVISHQGDPGSNAWPVSGSISVSNFPATYPVTDNAGSLTVDNNGTFAVQAAQSGVWTVAGGANVFHVDDNAGSLTVDGTVTANQGGSNWSINSAQVAGTAVDTNSGTKSAGTQRVVLATDQPALTNKLLVTADAITQSTSPWVVGGDTASGSADANNPVKIGGKYNATKPTYADGNRTVLETGTRGSLRVELWGADDGTNKVSATSPADAGSNSVGHLMVMSDNRTFNETTWDRQRGNTNTTTGDTGTKTTGTLNGATQTNYNARGAIITARIGTVTGAVTTFQTWIQWSPDGGTTWLGLTALGANDTAVSTGKTYTWMIYPTNISQAAGNAPAVLVPNVGPTQLNINNSMLPRTWRWNMSLTVATSLVLTEVDVNYIL